MTDVSASYSELPGASTALERGRPETRSRKAEIALTLVVVLGVCAILSKPFGGPIEVFNAAMGLTKPKRPSCRKAAYGGLLEFNGERAFVLYSGAAGDTRNAVGMSPDDLWTWSEKRGWNQIERKKGQLWPAPGRFNGCAASNGTADLFVYGGGLGEDVISDAAWKFHAETRTWSRWTPGPDGQGAELDTRRKAPSCALIGGTLWAFGGRDTKETDTVWAINPSPALPHLVDYKLKPAPRKGACARGYTRPDGQEVMIMHGGRRGHDYMDELWEFSPKSGFRLLFTGGPPRRNHHACTVIGDEFFIFAGRDGRRLDDVLADLWSFNLVTGKWKQLGPMAEPQDMEPYSWPPPRFLPTLEVDPDHPKGGLVAFGGQGMHHRHSHGWLSHWPRQHERRKNVKKRRFNDLWRFDLENGKFHMLEQTKC